MDTFEKDTRRKRFDNKQKDLLKERKKEKKLEAYDRGEHKFDYRQFLSEKEDDEPCDL